MKCNMKVTALKNLPLQYCPECLDVKFFMTRTSTVSTTSNSIVTVNKIF